MLSITTLAGRPDYREWLTETREETQVKKHARTRASNPELAEDAPQGAYHVMSGMKPPERIEVLKKYFSSAVVRRTQCLRGQLGAAVVDDFVGLANACRRELGEGALPPPLPPMTATASPMPGVVK